MPQPPGYIVETMAGVPAVVGVEASLAVFVGTAAAGPVGEPTEVFSAAQFKHLFGDLHSPLGLALWQFFANGVGRAIVLRAPGPGADELMGALAGLELVDYFGLLCLPDTFVLAEAEARTVAQAALAACEARGGFFLVDAPQSLALGDIVGWTAGLDASSHGAVFFPSLRIFLPQQPGATRVVGPAASVAGVFVRTDLARGLWKAPAGVDSILRGAAELTVPLTDAQNGLLNPEGVNALRQFPSGPTVWGSRTLRGKDAFADDFKYVPVRRLASYIEQSVRRAVAWAVFEPNDERLWSRLRQQVGDFLHDLYRQGAFQGATPREAYYVICDASTNPQVDLDLGRLNLLIGIAPLKRAEFIPLHLTLAALPR